LFRSVLHLSPGPLGAGAIVDFYERNDILLKALRDGGCLQAEVQVRVPHSDDVVVTALWLSAAEYERWIGSPARRTDAKDLEGMLAPDVLPLGAGDLYEVVATTERADR